MNKEIEFYDNSRISDYKKCPMYFYKRHVKHFTSIYTSYPLVFGTSIHKALEEILPLMAGELEDAQLLSRAMKAYEKAWIEEGLPSFADLTLEDLGKMPKHKPEIGKAIITDYISRRRNFFRRNEVLSVEEPFAIPVLDMPNVYLIGRLDGVAKINYSVWVVEHKTSSSYSKDYIFLPKFMKSFDMNAQIYTYQLALNLLYPGSQGVYVDLILVHKKVRGLEFIPQYKTIQELESWLEDTKHYIREIQRSKRENLWPRNLMGCQTMYGFCPFYEHCRLHDKDELPVGCKIKKWEPFDEAELKRLIEEENV